MDQKKPLYVLHYAVTEETYIHLYAASQNGLGKLNQFIMYDLLFNLIWLPLFWILLPLFREGREWLLYGYYLLPVALLLGFTYSRLGTRLFAKWTTRAAAARSRRLNVPFYHPVLSFFYDTCFEMKTPYADAVYSYQEGSERLCETSRYVILFQKQQRPNRQGYRAHAFDKRIIPEQELDAFRRFLEERCRLSCRRVRF